MCEEDYQGFRNLETFIVNQVLERNADSQKYWHALAAIHKSVDSLASELEDQVSFRLLDESEQHSELMKELIGAAMDRVDFRQIAQRWTEGVR